MAGSGRPQQILRKSLKPKRKKVIDSFDLALDNVVSADSDEVTQLLRCLRLIGKFLPSNSPNADEQSEAATDSEPEHPKPIIYGMRKFHATQRTQDTMKDIPQYLEKLRVCESLEDFRGLAANLNGNRHSKVEFSELAFRHMLRNGCCLETLLQFLSDPSLNIQEARNLPRLLEWFFSEPRNTSDSMHLQNWLKRHISLGMLSKRELEDLVEIALHSSRDNFEIQSDIDLRPTILDGLSSSGINQIFDLDGGILNRLLLLAYFDYSRQNLELQSLGFKLFEACKPAQLKYMTKGISSLLTSFLVSTSSDGELYSVDGQISKVLDCLLLGSEIEASRAIASASQATLRHLESSDPTCHVSKQKFNRWWSLLIHHQVFESIRYRSEWLRIERALAQKNLDVLCLYLKHLSNDEKCIFLLRHWFTQDVKDGDDHSQSRVPNSLKLFNHFLLSHKDQKCPFILLFEYLAPRATLDRMVLVRLFSLLNKLELQETSLALFSYFLQSKIPVDLTALAKDIIDFTSPNPRVACTLYKITPLLPLESCPSVAEMMINDSDGGPGVPLGFRDLRQKSLGVSDVYPRTPQEIRRAQIELLNRMAIAYAQASHLYPRVAYRQVHQCYHLLLRSHGPSSLSRNISRAFTQAGVVRPLQELQGVGTRRLDFILQIIRQIEGDEVASKVDELVYTWRHSIIAEKAEKALILQLHRKLGLSPPEDEMTGIIKGEEQRKAEVEQVLHGMPRGRNSWRTLSEGTNAERMIKERTPRDLKFAIATQKAAMKKYRVGEGEGALELVLQGLNEESQARNRAGPVHIIRGEFKT